MPESRKTCLANKLSISLSFRKKGSRLNLFMSLKKQTQNNKRQPENPSSSENC